MLLCLLLFLHWHGYHWTCGGGECLFDAISSDCAPIKEEWGRADTTLFQYFAIALGLPYMPSLACTMMMGLTMIAVPRNCTVLALEILALNSVQECLRLHRLHYCGVVDCCLRNGTICRCLFLV